MSIRDNKKLPLAVSVIAALSFFSVGCSKSNPSQSAVTSAAGTSATNQTTCADGTTWDGNKCVSVATGSFSSECSAKHGTIVTDNWGLTLCKTEMDVMPPSDIIGTSVYLPRLTAADPIPKSRADLFYYQPTPSSSYQSVYVREGDEISFQGSGSWGTNPGNCDTSWDNSLNAAIISTTASETFFLSTIQLEQNQVHRVNFDGVLKTGFNVGGDRRYGCSLIGSWSMKVTRCVDEQGLTSPCKANN